MNKPYVPDTRPRGNERFGVQMLGAEQELALARAWREHGDVAARNRLVTAFTPLVHAMVRRFTRRNPREEPDLMQQAFIGLLRAADGFEPERGVRFSTYAAWWVRAELQDYRMLNWSLVRRGRSARARRAFYQLRNIDDARPALPGESRAAHDARVTAALGLKEGELDRMRQQFSHNDSSLHHRIDADGNEAMENLADPDCDVEAEVAARHDQAVLRAAMIRHFGRLPERERRIVVANVLQDPPMTLQELGDIYGVSRERVRQLRERGLERLREAIDASDPTLLSAL